MSDCLQIVVKMGVLAFRVEFLEALRIEIQPLEIEYIMLISRPTSPLLLNTEVSPAHGVQVVPVSFPERVSVHIQIHGAGPMGGVRRRDA